MYHTVTNNRLTAFPLVSLHQGVLQEYIRYEYRERKQKKLCQLCTRSSATAEKQRVSYLGWSADLLMITRGCSMHRTRQNRRVRVIFWHSNALIQKMLAENGFWHEITSQGHPRSFIFKSFDGQHRGSISSYYIACRISDVFEDIAS